MKPRRNLLEGVTINVHAAGRRLFSFAAQRLATVEVRGDVLRGTGRLHSQPTWLGRLLGFRTRRIPIHFDRQ